MIRWRYCLVLAMLLVLPTRTGSKLDEEEEEERGEDGDDDDEEDDDEEDDEATEKVENLKSLLSGYRYLGFGPDTFVKRRRPFKVEHVAGRRAPGVLPSAKALMVTRTIKKRPLECYVCAFKSETPLRACLDPTKYRVHTITCHSADDKCFTSVISKGSTYEAVVRGCRSGCVGSPETTCCELNRCNNQAFAMPVAPPPIKLTSKATKVLQPTVFFFVTILLVLQTVVKVAFV